MVATTLCRADWWQSNGLLATRHMDPGHRRWEVKGLCHIRVLHFAQTPCVELPTEQKYWIEWLSCLSRRRWTLLGRRKAQQPTFLATVLLLLTRPLVSIVNKTATGAVSEVAVQIVTSSLKAQREERASPLKPNERTELRSENVSSLDVWCLRASEMSSENHALNASYRVPILSWSFSGIPDPLSTTSTNVRPKFLKRTSAIQPQPCFATSPS